MTPQEAIEAAEKVCEVTKCDHPVPEICRQQIAAAIRAIPIPEPDALSAAKDRVVEAAERWAKTRVLPYYDVTETCLAQNGLEDSIDAYRKIKESK